MDSRLVVSIFQVVMQQLASPAFREVGKIWNVDEQLKELLATYEKVRASIDAWEDQVNGSSALETWLQQLERYCYDTEDLIDYLSLICATDKGSNVIRKHTFKDLDVKLWGTPHKIGKLRTRLNLINSWIEQVLNARNNKSPNPSCCTQAPSAAGYSSPLWGATEAALVSGTSRDHDKEAIVMELTSSEASGVSIIGMDGLGKTALARTILEHSTIKRHFPLILSASVSGDFQMEDIVRRLVAEYSHQEHVNLRDLLGSHRALIVLDDLWSVTESDWFRFKCMYLNSSRPGSKILTTTRNPRVAEATSSVARYLDAMKDEDCTKVIMQRAELYGSDSNIWASDVEVIAKKCKGMPVLAHSFGIRLSSRTSGDELADTVRRFKNEELRQLPEIKREFSSLRLNEPKLPPHLKRCFAYCSLFSPGHTFNREELIQLWEVEGFVRPENRNGSQPTGMECFDELLSRSILKPLTSTSSKQTMYTMHEFNHEFAESLASEAFHRIDKGKTSLPSSCQENLRHMCLICDSPDVPLLKEIQKCRGLRTFLLLHQHEPKRLTISYTFFYKLKSLRLLDLSHTTVRQLLPLSPLKLLRYLDLTETDIQTLPDSICHLHALRVLKLDKCSKLDRLPKDLNQLLSLTRLHVNMKRLASLPSKLGLLTNLEILSSYVVGRKQGYKVAELEYMKHLSEICISGLENISDKEEAEKSMLSTKKQLKKLVLEWDNPTAEMVNASDILEGLNPHQDLKELILRNYRSQRFPTWLSSSSRKLVCIRLEKCQDFQVLPSLGQLPLLKTLVLHSLGNVEKVDAGFCGQGEEGFRRLESLEFREMGSLVSWSGLKTGDMPCLHTLRIIGCEKLTCMPSLIHQGCLVYLEINNCPVLESLPELPSSMNGKWAKLIIIDSRLVQERCEVGGPDWPKIKHMACFKAFQTTPHPFFSLLRTTPIRFVNEKFFQLQRLLGWMMGIILQGVKRWVASFNGRYKEVGIYNLYWVVLVLVGMLLSVILASCISTSH